MNDRTDLAVEEAACHSPSLPQGVVLREEKHGSLTVTRVWVTTADGARRLGKPPGV